MNPIGHVGVTLGLAFAANRLIGRRSGLSAHVSDKAWPEGAAARHGSRHPHLKYWHVAVGSMLPDLVDKPLALFVLDNFGTRTYGHTLAFSLALCLLGFAVLLRTRQTYGLALAGASLIHLVLDAMWTLPQVLYWPLLGWTFPRVPDDMSFLEMLQGAIEDPARAAGDILGLATLVVMLVWMVVDRRVQRMRERRRRQMKEQMDSSRRDSRNAAQLPEKELV